MFSILSYPLSFSSETTQRPRVLIYLWLLWCCFQELWGFGFQLCLALRREAPQLSAYRVESKWCDAPRGARSHCRGLARSSLGVFLSAHLHACMSFILCSAGAKEDLKDHFQWEILQRIFMGIMRKEAWLLKESKCFNRGQDFGRVGEIAGPSKLWVKLGLWQMCLLIISGTGNPYRRYRRGSLGVKHFWIVCREESGLYHQAGELPVLGAGEWLGLNMTLQQG